MATNPSIILSGNNINDVITDQRAKLQQAQAMQQQAQLQQLQVAQSKQAFDDEKNFRAAFIQSNGDPDLTVKTAARLGVGPARIQAFVKSQADLQKTLLDQHKIQADTDKTNLEKMDLKNSEIHGALQPVLATKTPEEFEAAKTFTISNLVKRGVLTDDEAKQAASMDKDHLAMFNAGILNVAQLSDQAKGEAATSNAAAATTQASVATDKLAIEKAKAVTEQQEKARVDTANKLSDALSAAGPAGYAKALQGVDPTVAADFPKPEQIATMHPAQAASILNGMGMTANERTQAAQAAANLDQTKVRDKNTADHELATLNIRRQEVKIASDKEAREASQVGLNVGPDGISPTAKNIFNGLTDPLTARAIIRKNPGLNDQVINYAQSKGQKWDEAQLESRFNTVKELSNTSPNKPGGTILAASKMVQHAQLFKDAVKAISNGSFTPGNAAYNAFSSTFGAPEPNNLTLIGEFLGSEAAKAATGNAPQKAKLEAIGKALKNDKSERTLMSAADTLVSLGAEGLHSVKELADAHNIGDDVVRIVSPDTAQVLQSAGYDPKTLRKARASQPQAAPKVATLDDVKAYAQHAGISTAEAVTKFQSGGYKVQ